MIENLAKLENLLLEYAFQKRNVVRLMVISLLTKGHILIEDLPGIGKTTLAKAYSSLLGRTFARIQGTSDTLPQDIVGGEIVDIKTGEFSIKQGPIFSEFVLIDEINRMHPKTQSALMEAMEEKQVSISGKLYKLPQIHIVIATQNPIEYAGTYPLPEAQRDRFFCVLKIGFPEHNIQKDILSSQSYLGLGEKIHEIKPVLTDENIFNLQDEVRKVQVSDIILDRLIHLANWSRDKNYFKYGISPRGLGIFVSALRAQAYLEGRNFVIPEDGIDLVVPVFKHRIEYLDENIPEDDFNNMLTLQYREAFKGL